MNEKFEWRPGELDPAPEKRYSVLLSDVRDRPLLDITLYASGPAEAISRARGLLPEDEQRLIRGTVVEPVIPSRQERG